MTDYIIQFQQFAIFMKQWHDALAFVEMADWRLSGSREEGDVVNSMV